MEQQDVQGRRKRMRILIDIPDNWEEELNQSKITFADVVDIDTIRNGTPIDNMTNGDVIKAMFPNVNVYEHNGGATYSVNNEYNFNATWWNTPYQKGGKNGND